MHTLSVENKLYIAIPFYKSSAIKFKTIPFFFQNEENDIVNEHCFVLFNVR